MILNPLNPALKIKIGLAIALALSAFWYIRHRETKAYEQGVASGHKAGWDEAGGLGKQQRDAEWAKLQEASDRLDEMTRQQKAKEQQLQKLNAAIAVTISDNFNRIAATTREQTNDLPLDDRIWDSIRDLNRRYRPTVPTPDH